MNELSQVTDTQAAMAWRALMNAMEAIDDLRLDGSETGDERLNAYIAAWAKQRDELARRPSTKLLFHAFVQGVEAGLVGFNHKTDCSYTTLAYRTWWMHGCIQGSYHRGNHQLIRELLAEVDRLRAIILTPGGCMNCGDSDPFRVGKWGQSTADVFEQADPLSMTPDSMMTEKVEGEE